MNAAEHFDWAITRALEYADAGDAGRAGSSLVVDLAQHDGTAQILTRELLRLLIGEIIIAGAAGARRFIEDLPRPADPRPAPQQ